MAAYKYFLYQPARDMKTGLMDFEKVSSHASYAALLRAYEKKKVDNPKLFKVLLPQALKVGDTLYHSSGCVYGFIAEADETFWYIQKPMKTEVPPIKLQKYIPKAELARQQESATEPLKTPKKKAPTKAEKKKALAEYDDVVIVEELIERTFATPEAKEKYLHNINKPVCFMKSNMNFRFIDGFSGKKEGFIIPVELRA